MDEEVTLDFRINGHTYRIPNWFTIWSAWVKSPSLSESGACIRYGIAGEFTHEGTGLFRVWDYGNRPQPGFYDFEHHTFTFQEAQARVLRLWKEDETEQENLRVWREILERAKREKKGETGK